MTIYVLHLSHTYFTLFSEHDESETSGKFAMTAPTYLTVLSGDGPSPSEIHSLLKDMPHFLLYLTRSGITENSPETDDVIYAYPSDIQEHPEYPSFQPYKARGVFVTLCQLVSDVVAGGGGGEGSKPHVSSVLLDGGSSNANDTSNVVRESQLVHVGYVAENEDILLLALPGMLIQLAHVGVVFIC